MLGRVLQRWVRYVLDDLDETDEEEAGSEEGGAGGFGGAGAGGGRDSGVVGDGSFPSLRCASAVERSAAMRTHGLYTHARLTRTPALTLTLMHITLTMRTYGLYPQAPLALTLTLTLALTLALTLPGTSSRGTGFSRPRRAASPTPNP